MPAFPQRESVTGSLSYLRQHAQRLNCNPCFDHVPVETILKMNDKGSDGVLRCLMSIDIMCPCGGLERQLNEKGECCKGIFRRI